MITNEKLLKALSSNSEEQDANAAVALLLKNVNRDINLFLAKRAENPADPWSGQMAFPGGKRIETDHNLKQTIIRETLEETNINLLDRCRFLGVMKAQTPTQNPELKILPFVILIEHEPTIILNKKELESFFWLPLKGLISYRRLFKFNFGESPAYVIGPNVIWGITYRILEEFTNLTNET
ncbi:MAG: NUDIX hydrolase [Candidatus Bathycorpusculaceae bacterium]